MKNKLTLDTHSKTWWVSLISLILVFGQQVGHLLGWEITSDQINQIMAIVNTVLLIAGSLGLVYDTSGRVDGGEVDDKNS
ncbi:phage holin [Companilactobacillus bobalius]|uniref:Holin n=2 Tax=Companilactobacillus bobalius TaxID=2801451 RepID=A0A202FEM3_9LACO|nr:phage holin [Companilactobacillus bobalius]KAE9564422.1 hypothetical protein ATN92_00545 [Companilactobacillus bobalius]KRK83410.1 hypothetical protein FC78_GL002227 [Companilactobacillus bobalius DSM 19674]OVE98893.1 hypothetical protein LKACC16343_00005 [Companilactobacillus bobalius]GEO59667.1 hypothetical protein LBO01_27960 [Companilactobacillus paralimentarius]